MNYAAPSLSRARRFSTAAAIAGAIVAGVGYLAVPREMMRSYLLGYVFWLNIALGCLGLLMLQHLTGGRWGVMVRRIFEAATRTLPLLALLFIPLLLGAHGLYRWTDPAEMAHSPELQHKASYLNIPFFTARAGAYFAIWIGMTWILSRWSREQDRTADPRIAHKLAVFSGPGEVVFFVTVSFAVIDWIMSLQPDWHSPIFPLIVIVGQGLAALSFVVIVAALLARTAPLANCLTRAHFHDLGNLILVFVMLWAYMSFSQFLIIWSGNIAEETPFYHQRLGPVGRAVAIALIVLHFAAPFLLLLSRDMKRNAVRLAAVAALILGMRIVDLFWQIMPPLRRPLYFSWTDAVCLVAIGCVWVAWFLWQLERMPLLPINDPILPKALEYGRE